MPRQNSTTLASGLVIDVSADPQDALTEAPVVTVTISSTENRCLYALTMDPEEAQALAASMAATAISLPPRCEYRFRDKRTAERSRMPVDHKRRCMNPSEGKGLKGKHYCPDCRARVAEFGPGL